MPRLEPKSLSALESLRETAPAQNLFTDASRGVWEGGRLFINEFGEEVFIPIGTSRSEAGDAGPLHLVGDAQRNVKSWPGQMEVTVTNAIEGAL